ncbi:hypothetical protein HHI36_010461 [Cryptolaemus montrouzieri]|uniref:Reverse transcriptase Ty1/copia-type domain-containing protein n=1 Tax=Cryptolaemus montrouzieri TaxID=559131 RepID=A0ABD2MIP0_9CUCU
MCTKNSFPVNDTRAKAPGNIIHIDTCGPMETASLGCALYFLMLKENQTWTEATSECSSDKIITSKWVFKIKEDLQDAKQYKARLLARGFEQSDDLSQIYAPVAKFTTFQ